MVRAAPSGEVSLKAPLADRAVESISSDLGVGPCHGTVAGPAHSRSVIHSSLFCVLQHSAMILLRQTRCALGRRRHVAHFHVSPAWWAARKVLQRFKLADIGEGITECEVIKWYVSWSRTISSIKKSFFTFELCCLWGVILLCQEKREGWTSVFLTVFH